MKFNVAPELPILASSTAMPNPDSTHGTLFFRGSVLYQRTPDGVEVPVANSSDGNAPEFVSGASISTVSFGNGVFTKIPLTLDNTVPKSGGISVSNGAILVSRSGYYQVTGSYHFTGTSAGRRALGIDVTPNPNEGWAVTDSSSATYSIYAGATNAGVTHTDIRYVPAGSYLRLIGFQDSGATLSVSPATSNLNVLRAVLVTPFVPGQTEGQWITATLASGWSSFDATNYDVAQYMKEGNRVDLRGVVKSTSNSISTIFTLPADFRPLKIKILDVSAGDAPAGRIHITPTGAVSFQIGTATAWVSLDKVFFYLN